MKSTYKIMFRPARLLACCALVSALCGAIGCNTPVWVLDPNYGLKLAEKEKKPIVFYFKEWDSAHHRNMRVQVLDHPEVRKELLNTVNIELEFAWSDPYRKIYGVQKPQVTVVCDSEGNKVGTGLYVNPVPSVPRFLEWLREAKALAKTSTEQAGRPVSESPPSAN